MLKFCCVKQGTRYGAEYVNRLYASILRNLEAGTRGRFYCFTDDPNGIREEVHCVPLPHDLRGWWSKLYLFGPHQQFRDHDRIVYFDLDTVIVGDFDQIIKYDGEFAILRDFYRPDGWQSSVMLWRGDFGAGIWWSWVRAKRPEIEGGDQAWIEKWWYGPSWLPRQSGSYGLKLPDILQDLFPGKFCSYKEHCKPYPPDGTSVVVFHGQPRPHNCGQAWVEAMWSEDAGAHFDLKMIANVTLDEIREQCKASGERGLTRLKSQTAHHGKVVLVGGGPSLGDPITTANLLRWHAQGFDIWAMNGTLKWLLDRGFQPSGFVLLDARADNIRFLDERFHGIHYISEQCHPDVYDALEKKRVVRFELSIDYGTTVGIYAMAVAFVEGCRDIHLVGYDSSYRGSDGHAYPQGLNDADNIVDAHVDDRTFRAAPWMVRQAQDFEGTAAAIVHAGGRVSVHGDGLLPYMARRMQVVSAAEVRAQEVLRRLPPGPVMGAEIGVFKGAMSVELLQRADLHLMMIDSWEGEGAAYIDAVEDFHAKLTPAEQAQCMEIAEKMVGFAGHRAKIIRARSDEAASRMSDGIFDFVFIDADHSYEGCATDIDAWVPKLKPGALLCGHDYENPDFPEFGVKRAVDEFAERNGCTVELGENLTWFIRL
jgi:Methyltransferase domain/Protein of unknown function DUF115